MELCRRHALLGVAGCALVPLIGQPAAAHQVGGAPFRPPPVPMVYTRRLVRELRGGQRLAVSRSFTVRFALATGDGYDVSGEQVAVDVAAPEPMATFAHLERQRVENGVFPLRLDHHGWIERGPGLMASDLLDRAVAEARRQIAALPAGGRAEADTFIQLVHQAGPSVAAHLPADLFAPVGRGQIQRRAIELPGQDAGEIEIVFNADVDPQTGLMAWAQRKISTTIAGDRRTTEEDWALTPA